MQWLNLPESNRVLWQSYFQIVLERAWFLQAELKSFFIMNAVALWEVRGEFFTPAL